MDDRTIAEIYETYKQDPDRAIPYDEFRQQLIAEGLLDDDDDDEKEP